MTSVTDLSQLNQAVAARRVRDPALLYQGWLSRDIPLGVAQELVDYATTWDLDLTPTSADLYPLPHDGRHLMVLRWSGIERILRQTGLWMPGRTRIVDPGEGLTIEGSCWVRYAQGYHQWCEVSALATYDAYAERDYAGDVLDEAAVTGDWRLIPEIKLAEVAQYLAAAKAFGDLVTAHECALKHPRILVHHELIEERRRL